MSTPLRIAAFVAALAVAFALAAGVGRTVGPLDVEPASHADDASSHGEDEAHGEDDAHDEGGAQDEDQPAAAAHGDHDVSGLTARADGFTLVLADRSTPAGEGTRLDFTIETSSGRPLVDYERQHEKELHLIVVRRDLAGFQHVHPVLDPETGVWSTTVDLTGGTWRVIADFVPAGWDPVTLADDLAVAGDFVPAGQQRDRRADRVAGYDVTLTGDTAPGAETALTVAVVRAGVPVDDLQPYLGAHGHLVALRAGDLGYLHVHPEGDGAGAGGPEITFDTTFPTPGTYRLFLDFKHEGAVRTADFTVASGGAPGAGSGTEHEQGDHDH